MGERLRIWAAEKYYHICAILSGRHWVVPGLSLLRNHKKLLEIIRNHMKSYEIL